MLHDCNIRETTADFKFNLLIMYCSLQCNFSDTWKDSKQLPAKTIKLYKECKLDSIDKSLVHNLKFSCNKIKTIKT